MNFVYGTHPVMPVECSVYSLRTVYVYSAGAELEPIALKEFHDIRSALDTLCTNHKTGQKNCVFIENACTLSLLKWPFLACNCFLGTNCSVGKKMSELRIWNSFRFNHLITLVSHKMVKFIRILAVREYEHFQ